MNNPWERLCQQVRSIAFGGDMLHCDDFPLVVVTHKVVAQLDVFGPGGANWVFDDGDGSLVVNIEHCWLFDFTPFDC